MDVIKLINKEDCDSQTIEGWAAWYEGEEGWFTQKDEDSDNNVRQFK